MPFYTSEKRDELKKQWSAKITAWQNSGLSGTEWCKKNQVVYHCFSYWKKRLIDESQEALNADSFLELKDPSDLSGVEVVFNGVLIRLSKEFDTLSLQRCLQALAQYQC